MLAEEEIAVSQRQLELRRAEIAAETDAARARAAAAGPLEQAARDQDVISEQEKVAERRAALKDRELDTDIRKPADADRYRVEQEAQGRRAAAIAAAEGERQRRESLAAAVEREGDAEAAAILARGQAEAEARERNAQAFKLYNEAAVIEMVAQVLPDLVRAAAEPVSAIDKMTVISTDGASEMVRNVASNLEQGLQIGTDLTGVDLRSILRRVGGGAGDGGDSLED